MDLKTINCARKDCRFERLPNTATNEPVTPAVLDKDGKVVTDAINPNTTTYFVYCASCDRTFSQTESVGASTAGPWSSVVGKQHPTLVPPVEPVDPTATQV